MAMAPKAVVVPPTRGPLPYGLFSVLPFRVDSARFDNGVTFTTAGCAPAQGIGEFCPPSPATVVGLPKTFANVCEEGEASAFTVYGEFRGSLVGIDSDEAVQRAMDHLLLKEEQRVEQAFWTGDLDNTPNLRSASVIGTGPYPPEVGLALLEEYLASLGTVGAIHMTRSAATMLTRYLHTSGQTLRTLLDTPVAAGSGYDGSSPAGVAAADGESWLYATGPLFGYRGEPFGTSNAIPDPGNNDLVAVAERTYVLGFDVCELPAAVQISWAPAPSP